MTLKTRIDKLEKAAQAIPPPTPPPLEGAELVDRIIEIAAEANDDDAEDWQKVRAGAVAAVLCLAQARQSGEDYYETIERMKKPLSHILTQEMEVTR